MEKHVDRPQPAFLKLRAWQRSRYWMPARIFRPDPVDPWTGEPIDRWYPLQAETPDEQGITDRARICDLWNFGQSITEEEYQWLMAIWPTVKRIKTNRHRFSGTKT